MIYESMYKYRYVQHIAQHDETIHFTPTFTLIHYKTIYYPHAHNE